ncbi:MAG: endonuclease III [Candidatus Aenigmarchaeota archaeon]|nr:endonuclease III [Candidatus Aenigmarchaeota archaeon]
MGTKLQKIVEILSKKYEINEWWGKYTPFETLVSIILSQRTYWKNVRTATERFGERFNGIEDVAKANVKEIEKVIKPAGLYKVRARRIKNIAEDLVEKCDGKLDKILNLPYDEAKKKLTSIKGIGPKTADVFLMAIKGEQVLPIDVHIFRIMKRLGIADERDSYENLKAKLEAEIPPNQRMKTHLILIEFGRRICRARNPKCEECPIKRYCEVGKYDFAVPNI